MKKMMSKLKLNWIASSISLATMVMSPVAMGQEAQRISESQVQGALQQMGLNKQMTVGDFYKKNKHLYPDRIRKQIEPVITRYKNVMMPEFTVTSAKGTDGREITNVRVTQNGQLINLQWFGEQNRFLKFQNTNLTEVDIVNFDDMFTRLLAGDENFRKQSEARPSAANFAKKFDYPTVTKADWKAMTPEQRAQYIMNMKNLWTDARKVLNELEKEKKNKTKKTSSLEKFEMFWQTLLENAQAQARPTAVGTLEKANPDSCLVAGYVSSYKSKVCDRHNFKVMIKDQYGEIPVVKQANELCMKSNKFACNPLVFGTPNGSPICLDPNKANFQIATHYEGPCEANNHLGSKVDFLKDKTKKQNRYDADNADSVESIEAKARQEAEANNFQATKDYIAGLLKFSGKNPITGEIDDATLASILEIRKNFAEEIGQARLNCVESAKKKSDHEKNFYGACDQLHRRFLFVAEYINKEQCGPTKTTIDPETLKCVCPDKSQVNPGAKCGPPATPPPPAPGPAEPPPSPTNPGSGEDCEAKYPGAGAIKKGNQCVCAGNGSTPKLSLESESGAQVYTCDSGKPKPPKDKGGGFFDSIWKGIKIVAPFALAGLAVWGMVKIMSPKKPKLNPAGDLCPNGTQAPCPQTCAPPLSLQASGQCGCSACPPSQVITNAATCTCGTTGTGTDSPVLTCWDGVTKVDDLSKCPAQQYTCWDGSKVTNPLNCPERPTTLTPTGGSQQ